MIRLNLCYEASVQIGDHDTIGYRTAFAEEEKLLFMREKRGEEISEKLEKRSGMQRIISVRRVAPFCRR